MSRLPDTPERRDRAVSAVVGFVLIFGILVITFSLYQAQVVPQQNSEVEFEQHQEIQQQMVELRSNIVSMQGSTSTLSTAFDLGVRYPSRTIFVNPGPASGSLRTKGASDPDVSLTLRNVTATGSDETGDFWDGSDRKYNTSIIEYEPDFNRFQGGLPVVYEHSLIYNRVENGDSVPITDQSLINDDRINLIALNGTLAESGVGAESVDLEPVSTRTRVVGVNNTDGPITLEFASLLNASVWNETLENELVENGGHVQGVTSSSDGPGEFSILELKLKQNQDYELKLSKVGLGTGATNTDAEYLTEVEGAGATVLNDSTQKLTVEARDRFNGPQSDVMIEAAAEGGTFDGNSSKETDSEGQATFVYDPDSDSDGTYNVNFTIDSDYTPKSNSNHNASTRENVTMSVKVTPNSGSGGGGGGAYKVRWDNSQIKNESGVGNPNSANRYNYSLESGNLSLTMFTDPVADNATVEYAVNDTSIANLTNTTGTTDTSGENVTKLQPKTDGLVRVYTSSGGSGDEIQIRVTAGGNASVGDETIIYQNPNSKKKLNRIEGNGSNVKITTIGSNVKVIGQPERGISDDDTLAIPYINNSGGLNLIDINNGTTKLVDNNGNDAPKEQKSTMATGIWNESVKSVFYANTSGDAIYRVDASGTTEKIKDLTNVKAVLDIGDIDADDNNELIYIDGGNNKIRYIDQDGDDEKVTGSYSIGTNNGPGSGELVKFNGTKQVIYIDGSQNIALAVADNGANETFKVNNASKARATADDVDNDGDIEFVYVDGSGNLKYADNLDPVTNDFTVKPLKDADGNELTADNTGKRGVVSEG